MRNDDGSEDFCTTPTNPSIDALQACLSCAALAGPFTSYQISAELEYPEGKHERP